MSSLLNGVRVPHRKHTADKAAVRFTDVKTVTIPMQMHIGAPATPIVAVGDTVKVGTLIAEAAGRVSAPIHSSVSGKVTKITNILTSNGTYVPAIVIESDGEMACEELSAPTVESRDDLIEAIKNSGAVGLGGAGFPTHVKFNVEPSSFDELIVNGAECEPYITSDSLTMTERADDIKTALIAIKKFLNMQRIIIGIENNKKNAIDSMQNMCSEIDGAEVRVLPSIYPQGGEKVLIYHTTGKKVPTGKLPLDVRCVVVNCTTLAVIGNYLKTGMPLVEKCVTVDGGAIKEPQNVIVPIGTMIEDLINFTGGFSSDPEEILYGGPMMGYDVPSLDFPILKNTNAILALTHKEAKLPKTTACIRCGACTNVCPFGLAPAEILLAYKKKDAELLEKLSINTCMECGCCSFTCPANRPLAQTNKLSKIFLREYKAKEALKNG